MPQTPGGAAGAQGTLEPSPLQILLGGPLSSLAGLRCMGPLPSQGLPKPGHRCGKHRRGASVSESPSASLLVPLAADPPQSHSCTAPCTKTPFPRLPDLRQVCLAPLCPEGPAAPCQALDIPPRRVVRVSGKQALGPGGSLGQAPSLALEASCGRPVSQRCGPVGQGTPRAHPPQWRLLDGAATWEAECWPPAPWWPLRGSQDPVLEHAPAGTGSPAAPLLGFSIKVLLRWPLWPASSGQCGARSGPPWEQHRPRRGGLPSDLRSRRTRVTREDLELRGNPRPWEPRAQGHPALPSLLQFLVIETRPSGFKDSCVELLGSGNSRAEPWRSRGIRPQSRAALGKGCRAGKGALVLPVRAFLPCIAGSPELSPVSWRTSDTPGDVSWVPALASLAHSRPSVRKAGLGLGQGR